jgi:hypothetical protein
MRRRVIQPGERVRVRLTPPQRDLVIEHAFIDPELAKRLRVAEADGASIVALLDLDDLDELLGAVAAEANHTKDEKLRKRLDVIWERLRDVAESHTDDPSPAHPATFFSLVKELVSAEVHAEASSTSRSSTTTRKSTARARPRRTSSATSRSLHRPSIAWSSPSKNAASSNALRVGRDPSAS